MTTAAATVRYTPARSAADQAAVARLREIVYVLDQGRLNDVADTSATFDRFDAVSTYILAYEGAEAIGTVKVVPDGGRGLPCDDTVDLSALRPGNKLVEIGHLMTVPAVRDRAIGLGLMREALRYSVVHFGATHLLGDFFADEEGGRLRAFYTGIGFVAVGEAYPDHRFAGSPLSVVGALDIRAAVGRTRADTDRRNRLMHYFFGDYHTYAGTR